MPYEGERASGESLIAIMNSPALKDFRGQIGKSSGMRRDDPPIVSVPRRGGLPRRIIAIDGSIQTERVANGFPGAELSLVTLAAVLIDTKRLAAIRPGEIPSPTVFTGMDRAETHAVILPGCNVAPPGEEARDFFRATVYEKALDVSVFQGHETLLDTLRALDEEPPTGVQCPVNGCNSLLKPGRGVYACPCGRPGATLYETDTLRFHERFTDVGANGEVHGEVRHVVEVLSLVNLLRLLEKQNPALLKEIVFVLDGPLAVFGQPARIAPSIRRELVRIGEVSRRETGEEPLIIGVEKTGQYVTHFEDIDWTNERGPRSRFEPGTALMPGTRYVNRNITLRPEGAKASGSATYFGRKIFYKTASGSHATLSVGMTNQDACDFANEDPACLPRLGDALDVLDHLSTYLYQDGFMPIVRAHAHAAIPLGRGGDILKNLIS